MSCKNVQERISLILDGMLPDAERESVLAHIELCRECGTFFANFEAQRSLMRSMAPIPVPDLLAARLRVVASHEREHQLARVSVRERVRRVVSALNLAFENMMRPVALPIAGGLLSTILLFSLMMPSLSFAQHPNAGGYDYSTEPRGSIVTNPWDDGPDADAEDFPMIGSPSLASDYVNIVNLTIDESGRVVDWKVVRGRVTDEIATIIIMGRFEPATNFGIPISGTIQVRQGLPPCKYTRCSATVRG